MIALQRLFPLLLLLSGVAACANDVMDAQCTPDSPDESIDDDCPYQQRGPQVVKRRCEFQQEQAGTAAGWGDVFPIFLDTARGNCSAAGCHGVEEAAANGIYLPADNQQKFYDTLVNTNGSQDKPYVNQQNPADSWIHCNVAGTPGGGYFMPKPAALPSKADALIVEDWVLNGALGP